MWPLKYGSISLFSWNGWGRRRGVQTSEVPGVGKKGREDCHGGRGHWKGRTQTSSEVQLRAALSRLLVWSEQGRDTVASVSQEELASHVQLHKKAASRRVQTTYSHLWTAGSGFCSSEALCLKNSRCTCHTTVQMGLSFYVWKFHGKNIFQII